MAAVSHPLKRLAKSPRTGLFAGRQEMKAGVRLIGVDRSLAHLDARGGEKLW